MTDSCTATCYRHHLCLLAVSLRAVVMPLQEIIKVRQLAQRVNLYDDMATR